MRPGCVAGGGSAKQKLQEGLERVAGAGTPIDGEGR
jgi:hypothetical protein